MTTDTPNIVELPHNRRVRVELGDRVARAIVMENSGRPSRRAWWIMSAAVLARCDRAA